jgi:uroporphyrinogen decarboxylase
MRVQGPAQFNWDYVMNKREAVLHISETGTPAPYTPAAFFLHFPPSFHRGDAAVTKHVEYFRATGNDIMKVQFEKKYPRIPDLTRPEHWADVPVYDERFYAEQLDVVQGVVNELKAESIVLVTLYSAYMFASHFAGTEVLDRHLQEDPEAVGNGLARITDSMLIFVRECIKRGVDGFYASTQGGEADRFADPSIFDRFIRPYEMRIWDEIDSTATLNILHVCDYAKPYDTLDRFADYPGKIVNAPLHQKTETLTGGHIAQLFGRPFFGGMERLGTLSTGPGSAVEIEARAALEAGPEAMILGADCTLLPDASWENIRRATSVAHGRRRSS